MNAHQKRFYFYFTKDRKANERQFISFFERCLPILEIVAYRYAKFVYLKNKHHIIQVQATNLGFLNKFAHLHKK